MNIILQKSNPEGAYPPIQTWDSSNPPLGYAIVPDALDITVFYTHNGFVILTLDNSVVTAIEPNLPAWEAWKASLPLETAPPPTVEDDLLENIAGQLTEQGAALADVMKALAELAGLVAEGSGTNG